MDRHGITPWGQGQYITLAYALNHFAQASVLCQRSGDWLMQTGALQSR